MTEHGVSQLLDQLEEEKAFKDALALSLYEFLSWVEHWEPGFTRDVRWPAVEARARATLKLCGRLP